jgi:hypothetical protein
MSDAGPSLALAYKEYVIYQASTHCYHRAVHLPKRVRSGKVSTTKGETMRSLKVAGIPALLVLCVGLGLGQDTAHDVDKGATKTGDFVKHAGKKVGHATKSGVKDAGHGTKVVAKDSAKGVKKASEKTGEGIKDAASK